MADSVDDLTGDIVEFARRRRWRRHHTPKNLVMALSVEVGELMEHFMWMDGKHSKLPLPPWLRGKVRAELGDVMIYLCNLAATLGIDLIEAAHEKLAEAEQRYPASRGYPWSGSALKKT